MVCGLAAQVNETHAITLSADKYMKKMFSTLHSVL